MCGNTHTSATANTHTQIHLHKQTIFSITGFLFHRDELYPQINKAYDQSDSKIYTKHVLIEKKNQA